MDLVGKDDLFKLHVLLAQTLHQIGCLPEIDVAIINGIFNLNPAREAIFRELARVVRPAGTVYAAELILSQPLPPEPRANESDWFA